MKSSHSTKCLVPIFPNRYEAAAAKDCGDFGRGTFVANLELPGGELVFAFLVFGRDDASAHSAMQMFTALPGVTAGLSVTAGAHHRYSDYRQRVSQRRALACAEHDAELRESNPQRAHQLRQFAVGHRKKRTKSARRRA